MKDKKYINSFEEFNENLDISNDTNDETTKPHDEFGAVNIRIDGHGFIKTVIVDDIRKVLSKYQGKRKLFVDGKEVYAYMSRGGWME